jgi:hypothetical protein
MLLSENVRNQKYSMFKRSLYSKYTVASLQHAGTGNMVISCQDRQQIYGCCLLLTSACKLEYIISSTSAKKCNYITVSKCLFPTVQKLLQHSIVCWSSIQQQNMKISKVVQKLKGKRTHKHRKHADFISLNFCL